MEERSVQIFILYERSLSLVFGEEEWLVGGDPFYLKFWMNRSRWSEISDSQSIFARSASTVASSKNVQLTLIGSQQHAFYMSLG